MASGERKPRSHTEANKELFEKLEQYSAEIDSAERKLKRGQKTIDAFFSQFDSPKPHDIEVSVYDPDLEAPRDHDINIKLYDPDNPDPEPEPPIKKPEIPREPSHDIDVKLYDPGNHDLEPETTETAEKVPTYEKLSKQEIKDVFNQTEFKSLEAMDYISEHAPPKYKVNNIGGAEIYLSEIIPEEERPHVVAYVKAEGKDTIVPNPFYRSCSSMLWRLLPQLRRGGGYGKSNFREDAINAPFELQAAIEKICADEQNDPNFSSRYNDALTNDLCDEIDQYLTPDERGEGNLTGIIEEQLINNQESLTPEFNYGFMKLPDPQKCVVPDNLSPNFGKVESEWQAQNDVYGEAIARRFKSRDGSLEYLIFQTKEGGRAWVGAIECADSKVSSKGLREHFITPGAITTPLYEYGSQAKGINTYWGNPNDIRGNYVGMDRYQNNIPLIQEFHQYF